MALQVELVSAERKVWAGTADMVIARTAEGDLGILPGHSPVLSVLLPGDVKIKTADKGEVHVVVGGGFLSVEHDRVMLVAGEASLASATAGN